MASSARIDELRKKFDENPRRYFAPLANEYRKSGDLEQAIFICQEYLPQQPGHMSGHIVYGQALFELSRFDEARAVFETALSLDPENLIALRHLGDIARQAGDLRGARGWYQRVLEADPRNEEIAQIMMTLLATPDDSMPAVPTADVSSTVPVDVARVPTPLSTVVIEKSPDATDLDSAPELSSLREAALPSEPPPVPTSTWGDAPPANEHELLDLEDFSVGGVPLSSLGAPPPEIDPVGPPPIPESAAAEADEAIEAIEIERTSIAESAVVSSSENVSDEGFDLGTEEPLFEADPFAIATTPASSHAPVDATPIELASDLDLGLRPDGMTSTTFSEAQGERIADLESFGETLRGAEAADAAKASPLEVDAFFADMARDTGALGDPSSDAVSPERVETRTPTPQFIEAVPAFSLDTPESLDLSVSFEEAATPTSEGPPPADEPPPIPALESSSVDIPPLELPSFDVSSTEMPTHQEPSLDLPPLEVSSFDMPAGEIAPIAETPDELESQPVAAVPAAPIWTPPEPEPAVPSEEFITETMAELYLEQGHPEAAVDIYRRLSAQRPDDEQLASRLRAVEATLNGEPLTPADDSVVHADRSTGQTIRDFLAGLLRLAPSSWQVDSDVPPAASEEMPAIASSETPLSTPRVPTPMYDFEAIAPLRVPTPPYDLDAIAARSIPTPIYGLPEVEPEPSLPEQPTEEPAVVEAYELSVDDSSVDDSPVEEEPTVESFDDMEVSPPTPAYFTPVYSTPIQSTPAHAARPHATPPRSTPARPTLVRTTPGASDTVSGSIDALFSGASASSADADAAAALSQAFAPDAPEATELPGKPAHAASNELSLDHVFKSTPPRPKEAENDGFSFDQFFADDLSEASPKAGAEPPASSGKSAASGETGEDIAQFNNWLNSLKKT